MSKNISQPIAGNTHKIQQCFTELIRLANEADHRFKEGKTIEALSSLAAIPTLHKLLSEQCIKSHEKQKDESKHQGVYL